MHPIIVRIYGMPIYSYGLMMAVSFLICVILAVYRANSIGIAPQNILDISLYILVSGIVGARLLYVFTNLSYYIENPLEIFLLQKGGLAFHGGFILALVVGFIAARKRKLPIGKTSDLVVLYLPLGHAIARIGCFFNGCCYGKLTKVTWAVRFPSYSMAAYQFGPDRSVHPVQLYSSLINIGIFIILNVKKKRFEGELLFDYLILYGSARFILEYLRADSPAVFLDLSMFQLISLCMVISGFVLRPIVERYVQKTV